MRMRIKALVTGCSIFIGCHPVNPVTALVKENRVVYKLIDITNPSM